MTNVSDLESAKQWIGTRFIEQCKSGPQVKSLPPEVKACGQFLGEMNSRQRGIHGTAAAIRVLADDGRGEARALVPKLIRYVEHRETEEESSETDKAVLRDHLLRDNVNVIKTSELLYGLSFVNVGVCNTEALRESLANRLIEGKINDRGWGYFLDLRGGEPQLLPTAHAVRALARHGYNVQESVEYLSNALTTPSAVKTNITRADISVSVFVLYVLSFALPENKVVSKDRLRKIFWPIWKPLESLLDFDDLEQNVEYARNSSHFYVRVPWQIYLLALACRIAPLRAFASHGAQHRLESILASLKTKEGFLYPHSGGRMSSRTNAILYDAISIIKQDLPHAPAWFIARWYDRLRRCLNSPVIKWTLWAVAVCLISISIYTWHRNGGSFSDAAPDFVSSLILFLLTLRKGR